jgi:formimidoylglutamate deiminase
LRVAYARAGYQKEANPLQARFIETSDRYLNNVSSLAAHVNTSAGMAWIGVAPHSVRAVPLDYLKEIGEFATKHSLQVHMHVAEQPAEVSACIEEHGRSPVALLETEGLLSERFTAVHAIHVSSKAIAGFAKTRAGVCACPTTERNLGDGVVPVDGYFQHGVPVSLGTDSQTQIDLFEDARELEYHLRLQRTARNVLAPVDDDDRSALAKRLFECATVNGGRSLGFEGGNLQPGGPADFFTVDLDDPSIAGASTSDLLASVVFSISRAAIKDVVVAGHTIVEDGRHAKQEDIVNSFAALQKKLWT